MPADGMLLLLDQVINKGILIYCFCILMSLLAHYKHVIVHSYQHVSLPGAFFAAPLYLFKGTVLRLLLEDVPFRRPVLMLSS